MLETNQQPHSIQIGLASPEQIRSWSHGEVTSPETINYRTLKAEPGGLFCERIFGPTRDYECQCGKYKKSRDHGRICEKCGVEVTHARVRRERMGHIELAAPVSHIWFFKGVPSRLGLLLDVSPKALERVLYFAGYIVTDPGPTDLRAKQILTENEYREYREIHGSAFKAGMGAEAIRELLQRIDLDQEAELLREEMKGATGQKLIKASRRLDVVEAFRSSGNRPEWMILEVLPVIPPDLRPMVQMEGGRFATSDLNDLYRRVINRNLRLKKLLELGAPEVIVRNEKRMLQEAVDALIDNGRRGNPITGAGNRPLKSLSDMLKGKQGRFRQNLLGKRVDFSGRSVIVVGPNLKLHQCGLPKEMALELFKPFVMKRLVADGLAQNIRRAKTMVERMHPDVWDALEEVIKDHPVLLNRAPTLHRLGIQAFEPVLVEGRAIQIHPLVCTPYNADFDGDQMAVHVPLSAEAQAEARILMLSSHNVLSPKDGEPVITPSKDVLLGAYYLTIAKPEGEPAFAFHHPHEALMAYSQGLLDLHTWIEVRLPAPPTALEAGSPEWLAHPDHWGSDSGKRIKTTVGRLIFNEVLAPHLRFRNFPIEKKAMGQILDEAHRLLGPAGTAAMTDAIKELGFRYVTQSGSTIAIADIVVPAEKTEILQHAQGEVDRVEQHYQRGLITNDERYQQVVRLWSQAKDKVTRTLVGGMGDFNPVSMMMRSGARGNVSQITQLAGMRGLMADPSGKIVEVPIKANFREGLTALDYFLSAHGTRKGLADTALRTADSGYLTRRLVDVAQDVIIREEDCGTSAGLTWHDERDGDQIVAAMDRHVLGRTLLGDLLDPETKAVLAPAGTVVDEPLLTTARAAGIHELTVRSVLTCRCRQGLCRRCYGINPATGRMVEVGEAVGIMAAQSIGEPGTQLTMRTFHTGGVAGSDITQGLPRVEEIFEARKPRGQAMVAEHEGTVTVMEEGVRREVLIEVEDGDPITYQIPPGARIRVKTGQAVAPGDPLTEGPINPHDLLQLQGLRGVQRYLLQEVQKVYSLQGVAISDKHIETIIRQMLRKVKVDEVGDTPLISGQLIDLFDFEEINLQVIEQGGVPATARPHLLGITKASLATESFLSAASFQETTRILTDAAMRAKSDPLTGLKENVIIGKLIPAGTGLRRS